MRLNLLFRGDGPAREPKPSRPRKQFPVPRSSRLEEGRRQDALPATGRAGSEELDDLLFDGRDLELSRVDPDLAPGAVVEHREGELAPPGGVHRFDELLVVSAAFLAVVPEGRLLFGEELLDGRLLLLEVGGDAENGETRAAVLLLESREQRELLPARHAPRRPEVDEDDPALLPGDGLEESARVELAREPGRGGTPESPRPEKDRKSTRLNSSHSQISYAVFCLKKKTKTKSQSRNRDEMTMQCRATGSDRLTRRSS